LTYNKRTKKGKPKASESWVITDAAHEAIINRELYNSVQTIFKKRAPKITPPRVTEGKYLLTGILKCGKCGSSYVINMGSNKKYYYKCSSSNRRKSCGNITLPKERYENALLDRIKEKILAKNNIMSLVKLANASLAEEVKLLRPKEKDLKDELADIEVRISRLRLLIEEGGAEPKEVAPRINELSARRGEIRTANRDS